jgi:putative solute:sodium symporter small subunit
MESTASHGEQQYWSRTSALTWDGLAIWFLVGYVAPWFAAELNQDTFIGFPLGYYMVCQGALITFVLLIFIQNWIQDGIDHSAGYDEK